MNRRKDYLTPREVREVFERFGVEFDVAGHPLEGQAEAVLDKYARSEHAKKELEQWQDVGVTLGRSWTGYEFLTGKSSSDAMMKGGSR